MSALPPNVPPKARSPVLQGLQQGHYHPAPPKRAGQEPEGDAVSGGGKGGEIRLRNAKPEQKQAGGIHNRAARRAAQAQGILVQPDGSPITNPLGADLSIPVDYREPLTWRGFGFRFTTRDRDTDTYRCADLSARVTRYSPVVFVASICGCTSNGSSHQDALEAARRTVIANIQACQWALETTEGRAP